MLFRYFSIAALLLLTGCQYGDFLPYYKGVSKQTHLPGFSAWRSYMGSNHGLRSCYDITCYDWRLHVDQEKQAISGEMTIRFVGVVASDSILLDMGQNLKISEISANVPVAKVKRKRNAVFVIFERPFEVNEAVALHIRYEGKPANIAGPIQWKKDKQDRHYVGTVTQGIGPQYMMPCKDLLIDEPDSCFIRVSSATNQVVAANGRLMEISPGELGDVYHFALRNPINVYGLSFNIGSFVRLQLPYTDVKGTPRHIEVVALDHDSAQAASHYAQVIPVMASLENRWGLFPWWEDGCKIVQSTFSAMEHQSAISMGPDFRNSKEIDYNLTLVHELSHEWWGNLLTASDYADAWLHEGFATYNEVLFLEEQYGPEFSTKFLARAMSYTANKRAVLKTAGVRYNSWANRKDTDIYGKGALILHTIRRQMADDEAFFAALNQALRTYNRGHWSTDSLIVMVNAHARQDFSKLIMYYLTEIDIPEMELRQGQDAEGHEYREYRWVTDPGFPFQVFAKVGEEPVALLPNASWQRIMVPEGAELSLNLLDSGYLKVTVEEKEK